MSLASWRVALRIARRDALRAKGRSALVLAMVALPVLGVAGADVVYRSSVLTPAERADRLMGRADALVQLQSPGSIVLQAPDPGDGTDQRQPTAGQQPTPEQRRSLATDPATLAGQLLPAGSVLTPVEGYNAMGLASSVDGLLRTETGEADLGNPVWRGKLDIVQGRAPTADHEVAVTRQFLDQSKLEIGGSTTLRGLDNRPFTITGVVEDPNQLKTVGLVARPGQLAALDEQNQSGPNSWLVQLPTGATVDWAKVQEFNEYGFTVASRSVLLDPPPRSAVPYYSQDDSQGGDYLNRTHVVIMATVAGMALLEIVLLAGPAFAVGARRSRRQLGLLAAGGGDRGQIRAVVLGGGVVLGLAGAVVGVVLAVVLVVVTRPWTEEYAGRRFGHLGLQPLDLIGIAGLGLVTGLLAAVVPAVQAARQDVVAALTGRGGVKPPSRKLAALGLLMLAGGAALALYGATGGLGSRSTVVLGGSMIAELGMVACTPMVVGLFGRLGRWLPLGPRLALRDSVRHRGRTAPAVAAVMAAVAGSVAVGIYSASSQQEQREEYTPSAPRGAVTLTAAYSPGHGPSLLPAERDAVAQSIADLGTRADIGMVRYHGDCRTDGSCGDVSVLAPVDRRCPLDGLAGPSPTDRERYASDPRCGRNYSGWFGALVSGGPEVLHNLFALHDDAVEKAAAQGKVVVFDPDLVENGKVVLRLSEPYPPNTSSSDGPPPHHDVTVDAVAVKVDNPAAQAYLTPQTVSVLGLTSTDQGSVWLPATTPSGSAEQRANAAVSKATGSIYSFRIERGFQPQSGLIMLGLTGFAALVALGAAGIATGLASADSQQDLTTLAAVGAAPGIRRTLSGFQCGVIAAMGAVLGTVCGIVPAVALRKVEGMGNGFPGSPPAHVVIAVPWSDLAVTLLAVPLLAVLLAALLTRSRIALLRRTG
ncbi:FtsX-like permease family protein [Kitasatospora sp. NPDC052896]|uniref:FtsX-like permease family protein n=1 Tax=Kitasatospora sp. NPDC052896 TaxID=3364061 RepID=UPI0037C97C86